MNHMRSPKTFRLVDVCCATFIDMSYLENVPVRSLSDNGRSHLMLNIWFAHGRIIDYG